MQAEIQRYAACKGTYLSHLDHPIADRFAVVGDSNGWRWFVGLNGSRQVAGPVRS